jgi:uncharacterized Rossmann fold enzyme
MKYILWGAGERGKRALKIIGEENVLAFADTNPDRIGENCRGKQILSPEEAMRSYRDCIYVMTPEFGSEEIEAVLEQNGIAARFYFDECPMGITNGNEKLGPFELYPVKPQGKHCCLYGLTLFSLLLYDYWKTTYGVDIVIVPHQVLHPAFRKLLQKEYSICELSEVPFSIDEWIAIKDREVLAEYLKRSVMDISTLMENNAAFFNEKICRLKGIHQGKRCFIVATGPSLTTQDLDMLHKNNEICFSMNRIYNIFSSTQWRPDYYAIHDYKMIEDIADEVADLDLEFKFVASAPESYWEQKNVKKSIKFYSLIEGFNAKNPRFSEHPEHYLYAGNTVTYSCLQLAAYMGFEQIYLLGVDFNYTADIESPKNHFPGYHPAGKKVRINPFMRESTLAAYESAKRYADTHGIRIYNATRGGKLEVFERVDFDRLFD